MKFKYSFIVLMVVCVLSEALAQDVRTLNTRIADLLARFPAESGEMLNGIARETAGLGQEGIVALCAMLRPSGTEDDTNVRFAVNGFTHYAAQAGPEASSLAVTAYAAALEKVPDPEVRAFLIEQLQLLGSPASVSTLGRYLYDVRLCDPAVRALASIGGAEAGKTILKQVKKTKEKSLLIALVQGLGDLREKRAVRELHRLLKNGDEGIRDAAMSSLARIGHPSSMKRLVATAEPSGVREPVQKIAFLIDYARRRFELGDTQAALDICSPLLSKSRENTVLTSSLSLMTEILGEKAEPLLLLAMDSQDPVFRGHALLLSEKFENAPHTGLWIEKMNTMPPVQQAEIITMLGARKDKSALPAVTGMLGSESPRVRLAAIPAAAQLGGVEAFPSFIPLLKEGDSLIVRTVQTSLYFADDQVLNGIAMILPELPPVSRCAMLEILGARGNHSHFQAAAGQAENPIPQVKLASLHAMSSLAGPEDMPLLIGILNRASGRDEIRAAQAAVTAAAAQLGGSDEKAIPLLTAMSAHADKGRFLEILPALGGEKALAEVRRFTESKDNTLRTLAMESLSRWPDAEAAPALIALARTGSDASLRTLLLSGYTRLVSESAKAPEDKLAMLKEAMEIAGTDEDRTAVLRGLSSIHTPESLELAGGFLDIPAIRETAVQTVLQIALPQPVFPDGLGRDASGILKKAQRNASSDYTREEIQKYLDKIGESASEDRDGVFIPLFNGKDLTGWKGLVGDPISRSKMTAEELAQAQDQADQSMREHWRAENGVLVFDGKGSHLCTVRDYGDFEMVIDWKIGPGGDSGIYLRGSPQVQIWDPAQWPEGSGGVYNNQKNPNKPLVCADRPVGEWNTFLIRMIGERVTVHLNGVLIVDNVVMENYWDRNLPIFPAGQIELQSHGSPLTFRNILIREFPRKEEWRRLFNGKNLDGWVGAVNEVRVEEGKIVFPKEGGGNLYTADEFGNFIFRFEFKLTPGANNGLGIRAPLEGDAAYVGMELQILDNTAAIYQNLKPYQYHGSIYGVVPALKGYLNPVGEWNFEEVIAKGNHIVVILNGTPIVDADIQEAGTPITMDGNNHPGLQRAKGHIGFLGHGSHVEFRNIWIKPLD